MSDFIVHKGRRDPETFARSYGSDPQKVKYKQGQLTLVELADGRSGVGSCLGCGDTPCIRKDDSELALFGVLDEFPGDPSRDVCPTNAIEWSQNTSTVVVEAAECIGCGLCVSRCPYGAINLADGLTASVQTGDDDRLVDNAPGRGSHPDVKRVGGIAHLDSTAAKNIPSAVTALDDGRRNLLARNLLHEVGLNCRTRRRGDTNVRIDAVGFSRGERPFVAEIETGSGVLESPRALLEDVAILHSRYGYDVDRIDPVSIILEFPSLRSEYYQVIRDIQNVLSLRCRTITIGSLIALLWHLKKIDRFDRDDFTVGDGTVDLSSYLQISGDKLIEPYPGAFTPAK